MSAEEDKLLDHNFDGIQEYDNPMPRWWLGLFYATIVFAIVYFPYYHLFDGKLPQQLYQEESAQIAAVRQAAEIKRKEQEKIRQAEIARARKEKAAAQPDSDKSVAETADGSVGEEEAFTRIDWDFEGDLEEGAEIFAAYCLSCHGKSGEGLIGPNLTDSYWMHGNTPADLQKTINNGVIEKGMIAWKAVLDSEEVRNVTAFVLSIRFSNPPNPKPPQGTQYPN